MAEEELQEEAEEEAEQEEASRPRVHQRWWKVLSIGGAIYVGLLGALLLTANPNIFPTLVMVGSFLVPVAFVIFFYDRRGLSRLNMPTTGLAFVYGGLLGVIAASVLEPVFIRSLNIVTVFVVGIIEEASKIIGVLVVARHRRHNMEVSGIVLGAAAGMGFAALESMGYAFNAFMQNQGSLSASVTVTLVRGLLSPMGHGTWTALLASVLFRESRPGHFRINLRVIGAYVLVVVLHGLWDAVPGLLTPLLGSGPDVIIGQLAVGAAGLYILYLRWREAKRLAVEELAAPAVAESGA